LGRPDGLRLEVGDDRADDGYIRRVPCRPGALDPPVAGGAVLELSEREAVRTGSSSRRERRRRQRALRERDRRSAKLAELHHVDALLEEASTVIQRGWIQHAWFAYDDAAGRRRVVTAYSKRSSSVDSVAATCLVGAVVHAAGGPSTARSQLVQRTIDLTWHALFRGQHEQIRWCPSPLERAGHVQDLAHWNDDPARRSQEVTSLLGQARRLARAEEERTRALLSEPSATAAPG
jgi:hypothetical protein